MIVGFGLSVAFCRTPRFQLLYIQSADNGSFYLAPIYGRVTGDSLRARALLQGRLLRPPAKKDHHFEKKQKVVDRFYAKTPYPSFRVCETCCHAVCFFHSIDDDAGGTVYRSYRTTASTAADSASQHRKAALDPAAPENGVIAHQPICIQGTNDGALSQVIYVVGIYHRHRGSNAWT